MTCYGNCPRILSYDEVVACLRQHYASLDQVEIYRAQLKNRRRRPGEPLSELMKDIRRLFLSAFPGPVNYMSELASKDAFISALGDRDLMVKVLERVPATLNEAFKGGRASRALPSDTRAQWPRIQVWICPSCSWYRGG